MGKVLPLPHSYHLRHTNETGRAGRGKTKQLTYNISHGTHDERTHGEEHGTTDEETHEDKYKPAGSLISLGFNVDTCQQYNIETHKLIFNMV